MVAEVTERVLRRTFASDNFAGVHPEVLEGVLRANTGHATSYGDDPITAEAHRLFRQHFGEAAQIFLTFNGTGANVVGLQSMLRPYEAVICSANAHIYVDECGAPERFLGSKLVPMVAPDGKLTPNVIEGALVGIGDEHRVQPRVVSITQSTELGTCYSVEEITTLAGWVHERGMLLHLDGARLSNAAAWLGVDLDVFSRAGVDVLSFGGTKNGAMSRRSSRVVSAQGGGTPPVHPKAVDAARFEDAIRLCAIRRPFVLGFVDTERPACKRDGQAPRRRRAPDRRYRGRPADRGKRCLRFDAGACHRTVAAAVPVLRLGGRGGRAGASFGG